MAVLGPTSSQVARELSQIARELKLAAENAIARSHAMAMTSEQTRQRSARERARARELTRDGRP